MSIKKIVLLALLMRLLLAFSVWHPDLNNHVDWGIRFFEYGPSMFFAPESNVWSYTWPNQPPGTIYIFALMRKVYELLFSFFWYLNTNISIFPSTIMFFFENRLYQAILKLPAILADVGIAFLIYRIILGFGKKREAKIGFLFFLFNPITWYNSSVWGQSDATINFFVLLSFYLLFKKKPVFSILAMAVSLYIKLSLVIFLPIYAIVLLGQKFNAKRILLGAFFSALLLGLATLPFSRGEPYGWLYMIYTKKVLTQQLHVITANAFNMWATIAGIHERPNSQLLGPLSYSTWGYLLFFASYIPLLWFTFKKPVEKRVYWVLALTAFCSFVFLTNMHERYLYPVFPYLTIISVLYYTYAIYAIVSLVHLINLYNFWWVPSFMPLVKLLSWEDRLTPRILGLVTTGSFFYLYRKFIVKVKSGKV